MPKTPDRSQNAPEGPKKAPLPYGADNYFADRLKNSKGETLTTVHQRALRVYSLLVARE